MRLFFREACACQLAQGALVHEDELVWCDAGVRRAPGYPELMDTLAMLRLWRAAMDDDALALLRADRAGVSALTARVPYPVLRRAFRMRGCVADPGGAADMGVDPGKRLQWQRRWRETTALPAVLAAATVWDAWRDLAPEPGAGWRGTLLASLVLRERGMTPNMLLPIDMGWKASTYRVRPEHSRRERLLGFVNWIELTASQGQKDLATLALANMQLRSRLRGRQANSRLPALARLFMAAPLVSVPMAARHLGCSPQAIEKMIPLLGSAVRQVTDSERFRVWTAP